MTTKITTKNDFLKPRERVVKEVPIQGFGVVRIHKLLKSELVAFQKWLRPKGGKLDDDRAAKKELWLIAKSVIDNDGQTYLTVKDLDAIANQDGAAMDELAYEIMVLNGYAIGQEDNDLLGKSDS